MLSVRDFERLRDYRRYVKEVKVAVLNAGNSRERERLGEDLAWYETEIKALEAGVRKEQKKLLAEDVPAPEPEPERVVYAPARREIAKRQCGCGAWYVPTSNTQQFCGMRCPARLARAKEVYKKWYEKRMAWGLQTPEIGEMMTCKHRDCKREFKKTGPGQKYCCEACSKAEHILMMRDRRLKPPAQVACVHCGKVFKRNRVGTKFCSVACWNKFRYPSTIGEEARCKNCEKVFVKKHSNQKHCGVACQQAYEQKRMIERKREGVQAMTMGEPIQCAVCGTWMKRKTAVHKYCGEKCKSWAERQKDKGG